MGAGRTTKGGTTGPLVRVLQGSGSGRVSNSLGMSNPSVNHKAWPKRARSGILEAVEGLQTEGETPEEDRGVNSSQGPRAALQNGDPLGQLLIP